MCAKKASNLIQIKHKHSDRPPPLVRLPEHFHLPEERFLSLSNVSFLFNLSHLIKDQHLKEKKGINNVSVKDVRHCRPFTPKSRPKQ